MSSLKIINIERGGFAFLGEVFWCYLEYKGKIIAQAPIIRLKSGFRVYSLGFPDDGENMNEHYKEKSVSLTFTKDGFPTHEEFDFMIEKMISFYNSL